GIFRPKNKEELSGRMKMLSFPLPAIMLGHRKTRRGIKAGKTTYHGFTYTSSKRKKILVRESKPRYPLYEPMIDIDSKAASVFDQLPDRADEILLKKFDHELKYRSGFFDNV
ncbi:MAG: hypothetical protein OIF32_02225, partial [Campylobacterales bacterium]|nr:hypothetical protein [Campylobacterales bacterium]